MRHGEKRHRHSLATVLGSASLLTVGTGLVHSDGHRACGGHDQLCKRTQLSYEAETLRAHFEERL